MSGMKRFTTRAERLACLGGLLTILSAAPALAGECPADKAGTNALAGAPTAPIGVMEKELAAIDLSKENVKLNERRLRLRHMEIMPGGVVPLHDHADRPALIMVTAGEVVENSSKCLVPIFHKPGDVSREFLGTKHWWKNQGTVTVMLTIADVVNDKKPDTMPQHM